MTTRRQVSGVLLLNKPAGISSNRALQRVKGIYRARKAGHTGSLDPLATGLLPLCFGSSTRFASWLLNADKGYRALFRLGVSTDTDDADGTVLERVAPTCSPEQIEAMLEMFRGDILQIPPQYSAIKRGGTRLYTLARRGVFTKLEPRPIQIHTLRMLACDETSVLLDIRCSKGSYIRSLARDLGRQLGCGAHVERLERTAVGELDVSMAVQPERLQRLADADDMAALDALLLPVDRVFEHIRTLELSAAELHRLRCEKRLQWPSGDRPPGLARVFVAGRFCGLVEVATDIEDARVCTMTPCCLVSGQHL